MCTYTAQYRCSFRMHCYLNLKVRGGVWGSGVFGSWGKVLMIGWSVLENKLLKAASFFLPCDDIARRWSPISWKWTPNRQLNLQVLILQKYEKERFVDDNPSYLALSCRSPNRLRYVETPWKWRYFYNKEFPFAFCFYL